ATMMITGSIGRSLHGTLQLQKEALHLRAPAIVADLTAGTNDPVAGNDDRDRVRAQRSPCGPEGTGVARPLGRFGVGDHVAKRHPRGGPQHPPVEARVAEAPVERQLEAAPPALEVLVQLPARLIK